MMPRRIFSKLFLTYFFISLIGITFLIIITRFAFENFYYQETSTNLVQKAHLIEREISQKLINEDYKNLQDRINTLSKEAENRITVILPDGVVVADSNFNIIKMDNHSKREEVKAALKGEVGKSLRFSNTLQESLLYVAIPLKKDDEVIGVLRNAVKIDILQSSLYSLTEKILVWSLLLLIILVYFIFIQSKRISAPLEEMKEQVEKFSEGDLEGEIIVKQSTTEEVSSLFQSIHGMSEKLKKQFQKINKQKNEQLAVFASMLEGVITIYPDMNIYHINRAALELFHYSPDGAIKGTALKDVVKSERIYQMAKKLLEDHQTVDNEFEYDTGLILNVHGTILQSEQTGMLGAVLVFNDITKMRELENHRKQFVANVSHELKTPLTAIQGYLETIMEEEIEEKEVLNKFLNIIHKHSTRLKSIIEDLLSLSSIERESEVGGLQFDEYKIQTILDNVVNLCKEKAEAKDIVIKTKYVDAKILGNQPLLEQAIVNLLDNAIKYGPEKSEVSIEANLVDEMIHIIVKDKGQGIPEEHHERLFERFYSVDKARSRELGGSGLGLAIVKHIALSHGGNVSVNSKIGEGSSFIFELPNA